MAIKEKTLTVELVGKHLVENDQYYATLKLPAEEYEIRDAVQRSRNMDRTDMKITIEDCSLIPELRSDWLNSPTIDELNFFAKRLAALNDDERIVLQAVAPKQLFAENSKSDISIKDLINITYGLDDVQVISAVSNDAQLGQFVIENDLHTDVESVPDNALYLLDRSQIGKLQRENDGGEFIGGIYVITGDYEMSEIYDGKTLPESEHTPWYAFRLLVAEAPANDSEETIGSAKWITLPIDRSKANAIAEAHNEGCIEDGVYYDFESSVPHITEEMYGDMLEFGKLNSLANTMAEMSPAYQLKFKAALHAERPENMDGVLDIAKNISKYEIAHYSAGNADYAMDYLLSHLPAEFNSKLLKKANLYEMGKELLQHTGAAVTPYGVISARGQSLYNFASNEDPEAKELTTQTMTDEKPVIDSHTTFDDESLPSFLGDAMAPQEVPDSEMDDEDIGMGGMQL